MKTGTVRTWIVSPAFLADQPETAGRLLAQAVARHPDDFWQVLVADRKDADRFMETHFWHYPPAEDISASDDA